MYAIRSYYAVLVTSGIAGTALETGADTTGIVTSGFAVGCLDTVCCGDGETVVFGATACAALISASEGITRRTPAIRLPSCLPPKARGFLRYKALKTCGVSRFAPG